MRGAVYVGNNAAFAIRSGTPATGRHETDEYSRISGRDKLERKLEYSEGKWKEMNDTERK